MRSMGRGPGDCSSTSPSGRALRAGPTSPLGGEAGQLDRERAVFTGLRLHPDRSSVALDDPARDGQSKATARIAALKAIEQVLQPLVVDARPVVDDVDRWSNGAIGDAQRHRLARR